MLTASGLPPRPVPTRTTVNFNLNYDLNDMLTGTRQSLRSVEPTNAPTAVAVPVEIIYNP